MQSQNISESKIRKKQIHHQSNQNMRDMIHSNLRIETSTSAKKRETIQRQKYPINTVCRAILTVPNIVPWQSVSKIHWALLVDIHKMNLGLRINAKKKKLEKLA